MALRITGDITVDARLTDNQQCDDHAAWVVRLGAPP